MLLTNQNIYNYAIKLNESFLDETQKLPIKLNFYLQKNKNTLFILAQEIENSQREIVNSYGHQDESNGGQYLIDKDNFDALSKELNDLFELEQEVNIYKINIDSMPDDLTLTTKQMDAIMFMIE